MGVWGCGGGPAGAPTEAGPQLVGPQIGMVPGTGTMLGNECKRHADHCPLGAQETGEVRGGLPAPARLLLLVAVLLRLHGVTSVSSVAAQPPVSGMH